MRLAYARSVATTSIVGHVLGLGDRHVSNILLDNGTGEVVHIDLGIAFDQVSQFPVSIA
jgi:ataxia telangiectasia mutated family protein